MPGVRGNAEVRRACYHASIGNFRQTPTETILGAIVAAHHFAIEETQRNAWLYQIDHLKAQLVDFDRGHVLFEFVVPRVGKRVDVILLIDGIIFAVEYKVGAADHSATDIQQAVGYAVDLKNFHEGSHERTIVPILVATRAAGIAIDDRQYADEVAYPQRANQANLATILQFFAQRYADQELDAVQWANSAYKPTPTICEAAQALYAGHQVEDISRHDAGAINLSQTTACIERIIEHSKANKRKAICFVTGVPGSGKTLAGLNLATQRLRAHEDEHAVFLSGNGPLVSVLREALARDDMERQRHLPRAEREDKPHALRRASTFIQNIHHFRDDNLDNEKPPIEKVVVFDEAQRAWSLNQTATFMTQKRGLADFSMSEPTFLLSVMDRHEDWCTVVCLVGGGQEINTGEAGLIEWFTSLRDHFSEWDVYLSEGLATSDHFGSGALLTSLDDRPVTFEPDLHLSVCIRSFRSEKVSEFVHHLIDGNAAEAAATFAALPNYPIVLTRDLDAARTWLQSHTRGFERCGLLASSNGRRLKAEGVDVLVKIKPELWFLNGEADVRSSYYLEDVATEFDVQGLELDWVGLCWDINLRRHDNQWACHAFKGSNWNNINNEQARVYLKNAYRVLLTRARQGMVIYVPEGDANDHTRPPRHYDDVFRYLQSCGLPVLEQK